MKKNIITFTALLLSLTQTMAQKYLDVYQNGIITKSISTLDIDSMNLTGNNEQTRKVNFYRDGKVIESYAVNEVDSIKVFRPNDEQLVYLGIVGFNQALYEKPIDILAKSTSSFFRSYVNELSTKAGTLLYYAVDNAIDRLSQYDFNTPISNVAIVTFTDGLDQGSLMMNGNYATNEQYLNAIQRRITNTKIKGLPLIAYSVGLRGGDVSDYNQFQANLQKLASSTDKAFEVNNMNDVNSRLKEISDRIISISNKQTVSMKIPGQSDGTLVRFTFNGSTPESSTMYIEGTFNLADRSLRDVSYHGIKALGNNYIHGTQDGIFVTFTFSGLQREDEKGLIPTTNISQYIRSTDSDIWQRNSEFTPNNNTLTTVTHSGAVVMLVLDCSSSLGSQFGNLQSYAWSFINQLANNTADFGVSTPTNVKAEINDDDFSVRVSWDVAKHAECYDIYRSGSGTSGFNRVASGITAMTWIDPSPLSGKNYYRVYALGYGLTSSASNSSNVVDYRLEVPQNVKGNMLVENEKLMIMVNWDASRHAESYNVYRGSSPSGGFAQIASNVTLLSWSDTSPLSGYNYYKVKALGHGTNSPLSNVSKVVVYMLDAPKNANASLNDDRFVIDVNWDAVDFAESYSVYRSNGASFSLVAKNVMETTWTDESPMAGNNYYKVYAEGYGLISQASETTNNVVYKLDAPQNVTATLDNARFVIRVQWDAVKHAESYDIYRSNGAKYTVVATGLTSTNWTDESPMAGDNYYKVYASGHGITSTASDATKGVDYAIDAPTNVIAAMDNNYFQINVSWSAVNHAESYVVYRANSPSGRFEKIAVNITINSWTDKTAQAGNNYYKVCAIGHGLTSPMSEASNMVNYGLDAPQDVKAIIDESKRELGLSWGIVKYAESYDVYRSGSSSNDFTIVAEGVTSTSWVDETPLRGDNYYRVYAVGHGLTSSSSTIVYIFCPDFPADPIDLGLPSGTKWASYNVGATKPEEYGGYYAWGETEENKSYGEAKYTYGYLGLGIDDISGTEYDVAHVKWGGNWVMPTSDDISELLNNCTTEWTTLNGVKGKKFTSKKNGNSIFLPATGFYKYGHNDDVGTYGYYWSSTYWGFSSGAVAACSLHLIFYMNNAPYESSERCYFGLSVRPVAKKL